MTRLTLCMAAVVLLACGRPAKDVDSPAGTLQARVVHRAFLRAIALDTLSDSARILKLFPEPDGDAVAFTFADPVRGITGGLGLLDLRRPLPQLAWPDSISQVRWRAPHELVFTTGTISGVRVIIDAHADTLTTFEDSASMDATPMAAIEVGDDARARATRFTDSIRIQPTDAPATSVLHYAPTHFLPAPHDSIIAFQTTAAAANMTTRSNPTWYLLDLRTGAVQPLDSLTGSARLMPAEAAAWTADGSFLFTKGLALYEARTQRAAP